MHFLNPRQCRHPFEQTEAGRPNIFVFTLDMVSPLFYRAPSPYLETLQMPAWDGLKRDAVCFDNAFSVSPLCGPSRASLFTGRYPYLLVNEERAHDGCEVSLRPDDPIYPEYLKAVGYLTGHVGKGHIGTEKLIQAFGENCSPWDRWAPPIHDDAEYHQYLRDRGINGFRFAREITGLKSDRSTPGNSYGGWLEQEDGQPFPMEGTYPHYLVDRGCAFLDSLVHQSGGEAPIYLQVDLFAPHQPFLVPSGLEERERSIRAEVSLPQSYLEWLGNDCRAAGPEPKIYDTYRRSWGLYDQEAARDYLVAHLLQMEVIDLALEKFLAKLKDLGLYENSVVVFAADHGEMNLEQGLIDKGVYGHPHAARVPLLAKLPGNRSAGEVVDCPVCLLDVAPTMLEFTGVRPFAQLDGENLLDRFGPSATPRDAPIVFECGWHIAPNPAIAVHHYEGPDRHYRYVYNVTSTVDELYDLASEDCRNLIDEPESQSVRLSMLAQMREILHSDERWRCYRQSFELDKEGDLPVRAGDMQMFVPE